MQEIKKSSSKPDLSRLRQHDESPQTSPALLRRNSVLSFPEVIVEQEGRGSMSRSSSSESLIPIVISRFAITTDKEKLDAAQTFLTTATTNREALMQDSKGSIVKTILFGMGWFFSFGQFGTQSAAEKNAAKNLLTKPTYELTEAIKFLYEVNTKVLLPNDYAPMTFENLGRYISAIADSELLRINGSGELVAVPVVLPDANESQVSQLQKQVQQLQLGTLVRDFTPSFFQVDSTHRTVVKGPQALLEAAQKAIVAWTGAIDTVKGGLNDAQFEDLVAQATNNVLSVNFHGLGKISGNNVEFLEINAATIWAKNNIGQFSKEIADKFIARELGGNLNREAIEELSNDIDTRARRMNQILDGDLEQYKKEIILELNNNPGFVTALQEKQGQLKQVVADNQNLSLISAPQLVAIRGAFQNVQGVEKAIPTSTIKGEAAAIAAINIVNTRLAQVTLLDPALAENLQKTVDTTVENIQFAKKALEALLIDNADVIAEGQEKAEDALLDLTILNQLVSRKDLLVNIGETNKEIKGLDTAGVATILQDELLDILDGLAGAKGANDSSPTLLLQVLLRLGENGLAAVIGQNLSFDFDNIFAKAAETDLESAKVEMFTFNDENKDALDVLADLRGAIKDQLDSKAVQKQRQVEQDRANKDLPFVPVPVSQSLLEEAKNNYEKAMERDDIRFASNELSD